MRGKQKFDALFTTGDTPGNLKKKGRDLRLLARRNWCITDRYYYYGYLTQKRYEVIIKLMSLEFFLSVETLPGIIDGGTERFAELKELEPPVAYFRKQWPFMKW